MQRCIDNTGFLSAEGNCYCTVCCSYYVRSVLSDIENISEESGNIFANAISQVNPSTYTSLVALSDDNILEKVGGGDFLSSRFMAVLAVLLALLIVAGIVFVVLMAKGVFHIPGINSEITKHIAKSVGIGLCISSFSYLVLGSGYLLGSETGSDNEKDKAISIVNRSRVRKLAVDQKEIWDNLDEIHSGLQSSVFGLDNFVTGLAYKNVDHLSSMKHEVRDVNDKFIMLDGVFSAVLMECADLVEDNIAINSEYVVLTDQNTVLSDENTVLKYKRDDLQEVLLVKQYGYLGSDVLDSLRSLQVLFDNTRLTL
ncbi:MULTISPECIES: hypothetical protein [Candidatus Ichthyocystis]|uniref:Putative membrane protein n=1 Tax=Candidatus Ichthyocystis hellenicum TaxID=1561003 RepID=A0A0S4M841_9BURK|nr:MULTISPECIES: hypothetical protein [Ichthyocystis]CUT17556.1 putative membrane protein [Candidatus Ichthyocystis hellenicum]